MFGLQSTPLAQQPAQRTAVALSRNLGVFTWAELQNTYPNGSAALASLPVGARAWVSDLGVSGADVTPSIDKARWINCYPVVLSQGAGATLTGTTSWTNTVTVPLFGGLLVNRAVFVDMIISIVGTAAAKDMRLLYNGVEWANKNIGNTILTTTLNRRILGMSSALQASERANATAYGNESASGAHYATTIDSTVTQNLALDFKLTNSADSITAVAYRFVLQ